MILSTKYFIFIIVLCLILIITPFNPVFSNSSESDKINNIINKYQNIIDFSIITTLMNAQNHSDLNYFEYGKNKKEVDKIEILELDKYLEKSGKTQRLYLSESIIKLIKKETKLSDSEIGNKKLKNLNISKYIFEIIKLQTSLEDNVLKEKMLFLEQHAFIIAKKLFNEIYINNNTEYFKTKQFIYPIHRYLSYFISTSPHKKQIIEILINWLQQKTNHKYIRGFASFELGMINANIATQHLLKIASDKNEPENVRYYSVMSLGMINDFSTIIPLSDIYYSELESNLKDLLGNVIYYLYMNQSINLKYKYRNST